MAEAILDRLLDGGHVVVEAPTGVGKTLAYLVAAVLSGRQVVISTNTKNLQDQIIDKDLPLLGRMLAELGTSLVRADPDVSSAEPDSVRYALMKGRSNYLCIDRLNKKTQQHAFSFVSTDDVWAELNAWRRRTTRGDRAELPGLPERSSVWDEVDARSEICHGTKCPSYESCFVVRMRKEAEQADLVVVNHHLLMADLALKAQATITSEGRAFGSVIPDAACLILDEAHSIEETASMYFGGSVSNLKVDRFIQDVRRWADDAGADVRAESVATLTLPRAIATSENLLNSLPSDEGRIQVPSPRGAPAQARMRARFGETHRRLPEAVQALEVLAERLESVQAPTSDGLARRARDLAESFRFVLTAEDDDYVYWSERQGKKTTLGAAPVRVGPLLSRFLFARFDAVALTSATLSAGSDRCRFFMESVGAPEDTEALVLDSPFDYAVQAALYLPEDAPAPSTPQVTQQLAKHGDALIRAVGGGAMYLFTSHRQMRAVHDRLRPRLPYPVLIQGDQPKRALLKAFVERAPAVLFATMSFWEGVDIPGDPLRLVLIDKLPFDAPDDPLVVARGQTLAAEGKSPFAALQLPRAILRLKQGFGRLVRGHADRGIVAILDRRLQTKGYGRQFLRALPATRILRNIEEVEQWWSAARSSDIEAEKDDG
ncbi:MAG: ATP-dependent DNA helicase [Myxococcota bacterium]